MPRPNSRSSPPPPVNDTALAYLVFSRKAIRISSPGPPTTSSGSLIVVKPSGETLRSANCRCSMLTRLSVPSGLPDREASYRRS